MQESAIDRPWWTLRLTYGLVPIVAGLDKFTNLLTDWTHYLSPLATRVVPVSAPTFMHAVGIIEIIAGVLVLHPRTARFGAYLVAAWLVAIAGNLVSMGTYLDVAVRDVVMGIGAFTLAKLTEIRARNDLPSGAVTPARDRIGGPVRATT
ncbi:MAG TPA: MauE/DoxX family redox-associated membrane protein [Kofleriaceae bacterium]|nr:MauE/DoxX family redox-associated membrane protein [Kofleriaceae bacterium]